MERLMNRTKDPSGQESEVYVYNGFCIEKMPYFLYEVCINKFWRGGFCTLGNSFFKSNRPFRTISKFEYFDNYIIEKEATLLGAPEWFIKECHLPVYKNVKTKKLKKNERAR